MTSDSPVTSNVIAAVGRALNMSPATITAETFFIRDLNAESIDFLDIAFEIEKACGTRISFKELFNSRRASAQGGGVDLQIRDVVEYLDRSVRK